MQKNMMKRLQKIQADMEKAQQELGEERIEGSSGGGAVKVVSNGHQELLEIHIDPSAVDPDDVEMLQDLVLAACNEALRKAKTASEIRMSKATGNLSIPGIKL
ncbi:MAG: YbaB/EbfC family nucleoid-associated protein [Clostridia bacterium]|nr:YbaB/EbfC family nucleoid-associated protein [Clostridia bacterium]